MAIATLPDEKIQASTFVVQLSPVLEFDESLAFRLDPRVELTDDELFEFCQINRELRIERDEQGELIIMAPAGGESGRRNAAVTAQLYVWTEKDGTGIAFDSSTGFRLGKKAMRSPDGAWVRKERYAQLTEKEREEFLPLCPDFIIELRSPSDRLGTVREKMERWIEHGVRLGWLIDPKQKRVYVYRPNQEAKVIENVSTVSGDPILPGFVFDLTQIW